MLFTYNCITNLQYLNYKVNVSLLAFLHFRLMSFGIDLVVKMKTLLEAHSAQKV